LRYRLRIETHRAIGQRHFADGCGQGGGRRRRRVRALMVLIDHAVFRNETSGGVFSMPARARPPPQYADSMPAPTPAAQGHQESAMGKSKTTCAKTQATATAANAASKPAMAPSNSSSIRKAWVNWRPVAPSARS